MSSCSLSINNSWENKVWKGKVIIYICIDLLHYLHSLHHFQCHFNSCISCLFVVAGIEVCNWSCSNSRIPAMWVLFSSFASWPSLSLVFGLKYCFFCLPQVKQWRLNSFSWRPHVKLHYLNSLPFIVRENLLFMSLYMQPITDHSLSHSQNSHLQPEQYWPVLKKMLGVFSFQSRSWCRLSLEYRGRY